jgi:hypothetical protein
MKSVIYLFSSILLASILISSCGDDDTVATESFDFNSTGLEDLGPNAVYEGWLIVDGAPVTTGTFTVDENGNASRTSFDVLSSDLESASTFVLTIEPSPDPDPSPSDVHILAGDFDGNEAALSIDHAAALGQDFADAAGTYILATPTDDLDSNEASGIWFLDNSTGAPEAGLELPTLPAGWIYEGWAVIDGNVVSTGTFSEVNVADNGATYSGSNPGPPFPGEDFLVNAPNGLSFPVELQGGTAVISIEPVPDNSTAPFTLKPLVSEIPATADVHVALEMGQNLNFPTGTIIR